MTYRLANPSAAGRGSSIILVGCGGTGSFVAEGLMRLFLDGSGPHLVLVDPDRVEERNLLRQNFLPADLGKFKAQALAERLAREYDRPVGYSLNPFQTFLDTAGFLGPGSMSRSPGIIVGCVDNHLARQAIARAFEGPGSLYFMRVWVDAGNGRDWGQVLVGNASDERALHQAFDETQGECRALTIPSWQQPGLLSAPDAPPDPSCAVAVEEGDQSPTINQAMSMLVVEVVRKLLAEELTWMQAYLHLGDGTMRVVEATPESVARVTGLRKARLVKRPEKMKERR